MDELSRWAAHLRNALSISAPDATVELADTKLEIIVWDETAARAVWDVVDQVGIPESALRVIRPIPFLFPYPSDGEPNKEAEREFLRKRFRVGEGDQHLLLHGLDPIVTGNAQVLVLGSMPGTMSLERGEYYAHPRNRFWGVIESLFGIPLNVPYERRSNALAARGIALWDVLRRCTRVGALDRRIDPDTEVPNDLESLLEAHLSIARIVLNGRKAEHSFRRFMPVQALQERGIEIRAVPSTSPANTRISGQVLLEQWRHALT